MNDKSPMTPAELAVIRARVKNATPGNWIPDNASFADDEENWILGIIRNDKSEANISLILNAPIDIPRMLDEIDRLNREIELLKVSNDTLTTISKKMIEQALK